jgi:hypothetical protein
VSLISLGYARISGSRSFFSGPSRRASTRCCSICCSASGVRRVHAFAVPAHHAAVYAAVFQIAARISVPGRPIMCITTQEARKFLWRFLHPNTFAPPQASSTSCSGPVISPCGAPEARSVCVWATASLCRAQYGIANGTWGLRSRHRIRIQDGYFSHRLHLAAERLRHALENAGESLRLVVGLAPAVADKVRAMVALAPESLLACAIERCCCWGAKCTPP